jgi:hypothetical protein
MSETTLKKGDILAIRTADIPPVGVGRLAVEHATGVVFAGFNAILVGYVPFEIVFA